MKIDKTPFLNTNVAYQFDGRHKNTVDQNQLGLDKNTDIPILNFNDLPQEIKASLVTPDSLDMDTVFLKDLGTSNQENSNSLSIAQVIPGQETLPTSEDGDAPFFLLSPEGGGGLSVVTTVGMTRSLTNEALPGETTASSGESHTGFVSEPEGQTIDGLHGIGFINKDFGFTQLKFPEIAVAYSVEDSIPNTLSTTPPDVPTTSLTAIDDFNTVAVDSYVVDSEGFPIKLIYAPATGNILSNDLGDSISLISLNGQLFSDINYNGTWTFSITDNGVGYEGLIGGGWTINFATASNPFAYTFNNSNTISILDNSTSQTSILVSGINQPITNITLTLHDMEHGFFSDLEATLTSPTLSNPPIKLFSYINGADAVNGTLTFDDLASTSIVHDNPSDFGTQTVTTQSGQGLLNLGSIHVQGNYGAFYVQSNGHYSYETNVNHPDIQSAIDNNQPQSFTDTVTYTIGNSLTTSSATLSIITEVHARDETPFSGFGDSSLASVMISDPQTEVNFSALTNSGSNNNINQNLPEQNAVTSNNIISYPLNTVDASHLDVSGVNPDNNLLPV